MPPQTPVYGGTIPENYDRYLGPYIFEPYARDLAARVAQDPPAQILELACGTGRLTLNLRKAVPGAALTSTDINPDMLAVARRRVQDEGIHWETADAQALPFRDDGFDAIVCQFGLMLMPEKALALQEARRVLRPGGRILFSTWDRLAGNPAFLLANELVAGYFPDEPPRFFQLPFSLYGEEVLLQLARDAGFREIRASLVPMMAEADSAEAAATGMLDGTPMYTTILEREASLLPVIRGALTARLAEIFGNRPMKSPMQAWVVEAWK